MNQGVWKLFCEESCENPLMETCFGLESSDERLVRKTA